MKLRAACLGVKIRAEDGLATAIDAISQAFPALQELRGRVEDARDPGPLDAEHQNPALGAMGASAAPVERGEGAGVSTPSEHGQHGCFAGDVVGEESPVLREMPNGLRLWSGRSAEEEAFFIYREVFEERTYARMGVGVRDDDIVWDVGASDTHEARRRASAPTPRSPPRSPKMPPSEFRRCGRKGRSRDASWRKCPTEALQRSSGTPQRTASCSGLTSAKSLHW